VTLAFGPEFVLPDEASLEVTPAGLAQPQGAVASSYTMWTAALGFEWRPFGAVDLRLLGSLRGSYNPAVGSELDGRVEYTRVGAQVESVSFRSEWRYQLAATLGIGVFFLPLPGQR
jgi:hypothetical protein